MEEYNWNLILKASVPFALIESYLFYIDLGNFWRWGSLFLALFLAALLVYINDKRKGDIFTAMAIVFLAVSAVRFLKISGFI